MPKKLQSIKGFYDVLPDKTPLWYFVEDKIREVLNLYAYEKINLPIVEPTSLFVDGEKTVTLKGDKIAHEFKAIVMNYVETHYSKLK